jgi:plasmid stabilization system protein ParE
MSYSVKILTTAETDAVDAALWYDSRSPGLGAEFLDKVNDAAQRLAQNPETYSILFANLRRAPVHRLRFYGRLYYFIHAKEVRIISIFHGRRHPRGLWPKRLKGD